RQENDAVVAAVTRGGRVRLAVGFGGGGRAEACAGADVACPVAREQGRVGRVGGVTAVEVGDGDGEGFLHAGRLLTGDEGRALGRLRGDRQAKGGDRRRTEREIGQVPGRDIDAGRAGDGGEGVHAVAEGNADRDVADDDGERLGAVGVDEGNV